MSVTSKNCIIRPVISEKSLRLYRDLKQCMFVVDLKASKKQIEYSFREFFGFAPVSVRVLVRRNRKKSRKVKGGVLYMDVKRKLSKIAYIDLGDNKLDIFEKIG